jgi:hypothetical protein
MLRHNSQHMVSGIEHLDIAEIGGMPIAAVNRSAST